jgi:hypothetical protein
MPNVSATFLDDDDDDLKNLRLKCDEIEEFAKEPLYDLRMMPEFEASLARFFQKIINRRDGTTVETPSEEAGACVGGLCRYILRDLAFEYPHMHAILDANLEMFIKREFPTL